MVGQREVIRLFYFQSSQILKLEITYQTTEPEVRWTPISVLPTQSYPVFMLAFGCPNSYRSNMRYNYWLYYNPQRELAVQGWYLNVESKFKFQLNLPRLPLRCVCNIYRTKFWSTENAFFTNSTWQKETFKTL